VRLSSVSSTADFVGLQINPPEADKFALAESSQWSLADRTADKNKAIGGRIVTTDYAGNLLLKKVAVWVELEGN